MNYGLYAPGGGLVFKLDLIADKFNALSRDSRRVVARNDLKRNARSLGPANLADRLAHRLPHDIFDSSIALPHADDLVAFLYPPIAIDRSAGHHLDNLERTIIHRKNRTHSAERQVHFHIEIFFRCWRHIVGVRIESAAKSTQIILQHLLFIGFGKHGCVLAIFADEIIADIDGIGGLVKLAAYQLHQHLVLYALAPILLRLDTILRPRSVLAANAVFFVGGKVPAALDEQIGGKVDALAKPLDIEVVDFEAKPDIAAANFVVERYLVRRELIKIRLEEHRMVEVVKSYEIRPRPARNLVIESVLRNMIFGKHIAKTLGDPPMVILGPQCGGSSKSRHCKQDCD